MKFRIINAYACNSAHGLNKLWEEAKTNIPGLAGRVPLDDYATLDELYDETFDDTWNSKEAKKQLTEKIAKITRRAMTKLRAAKLFKLNKPKTLSQRLSAGAKPETNQPEYAAKPKETFALVDTRCVPMGTSGHRKSDYLQSVYFGDGATRTKFGRGKEIRTLNSYACRVTVPPHSSGRVEIEITGDDNEKVDDCFGKLFGSHCGYLWPMYPKNSTIPSGVISRGEHGKSYIYRLRAQDINKILEHIKETSS